jgi:hypothetical protein
MGNTSNQYTTNLGANDSASLCFKNSSQIRYRYVVRADSTLPGDEVNLPGTIMIGDKDRSSMKEPRSQPAEDTKGRTADARVGTGGQAVQNISI